VLPAFYPIIDAGICRARGVAPRELAAACLRGGARLLQLRFKEGPGRELLALAEDLVALARSFDASVIINDRADIAKMAGADGVHVGQDDLPAARVRALLGPSAIVGLSTHTEPQIDGAATEPVSYIAAGPVFGTTTKDTGYQARGLALVRYAATKGMPVVAIGGITLENAPSVRAAGATSIAVISDLFTGNDPETRTRAFLHQAGTLKHPSTPRHPSTPKKHP
jgi:thiamine-phosphate pyrophosphorylase